MAAVRLPMLCLVFLVFKAGSTLGGTCSPEAELVTLRCAEDMWQIFQTDILHQAPPEISEFIVTYACRKLEKYKTCTGDMYEDCTQWPVLLDFPCSHFSETTDLVDCLLEDEAIARNWDRGFEAVAVSFGRRLILWFSDYPDLKPWSSFEDDLFRITELIENHISWHWPTKCRNMARHLAADWLASEAWKFPDVTDYLERYRQMDWEWVGQSQPKLSLEQIKGLLDLTALQLRKLGYQAKAVFGPCGVSVTTVNWLACFVEVSDELIMSLHTAENNKHDEKLLGTVCSYLKRQQKCWKPHLNSCENARQIDKVAIILLQYCTSMEDFDRHAECFVDEFHSILTDIERANLWSCDVDELDQLQLFSVMQSLEKIGSTQDLTQKLRRIKTLLGLLRGKLAVLIRCHVIMVRKEFDILKMSCGSDVVVATDKFLQTLEAEIDDVIDFSYDTLNQLVLALDKLGMVRDEL